MLSSITTDLSHIILWRLLFSASLSVKSHIAQVYLKSNEWFFWVSMESKNKELFLGLNGMQRQRVVFGSQRNGMQQHPYGMGGRGDFDR